jgi:hypothetical protein
MGIHIPQASRQATMVVALALAGLSACDDSSIPTRVGDAPVIITRIEIVGAENVPLGGTAQFSVIAHQSDGSTRDITSGVTWRTGNASMLTISPTGLATGLDRGETSVSVSAVGRQTLKNGVLILPAGTYRLAGIVRDAGLPVIGARVEVTAGTGQGLAATTSDPSAATPFPPGTYRLYGVSGETEIRVIRDGYQEHRQSLQVASHQMLDVDLSLSRPRDQISGTYTLTVSAAAQCALPQETRSRTYRAVVGQDGPRLTITLEDSNFFVRSGITYNSFPGTVEPDRVIFRPGQFDAYYNYLPDVLEQLATTTFFAFGGLAATTVSPTGLSGTLDGTLETLQTSATPGRFETVDSCRSTGHRFALSR